ncbi:hypothetical protein MAPG_02129 [Magnaporthiopsis poae ATCC 64411]|uniref:Uncharacterized protein n=1 Tax=Magnaporthiopsis poae (strain ATCC 64411 / 73-15) TaxID=644358 RepID=A0A0C4DQI6_MAGP6|nr:hypothetical protein MAPG_02129 [Magnaporthiopsis poae ATCC 64411]
MVGVCLGSDSPALAHKDTAVAWSWGHGSSTISWLRVSRLSRFSTAIGVCHSDRLPDPRSQRPVHRCKHRGRLDRRKYTTDPRLHTKPTFQPISSSQPRLFSSSLRRSDLRYHPPACVYYPARI